MSATTGAPDPGMDDGEASAGSAGDAAVIERSWVEPEAFATIFDRHARSIRAYVTRRLGHTAADDVVGDTFLIAFRARKRYDLARGDARPWLFGIASNLIGRHRRDERRAYRALARSGRDPATDSPGEEVEARVVAHTVERELAAGLSRLPRRDRDVVLLVAWADLSYDQTAEALGIPLGTVRSRLNRARRKLREALDGADPRTIVEEPRNE